jgi:hypothetical protein
VDNNAFDKPLVGAEDFLYICWVGHRYAFLFVVLWVATPF